MKTVVVLPSFERSLKRLTPQDIKQTAEALKRFNTMLISGQVAGGLGFKKINLGFKQLTQHLNLL